MGCLSFAVLLAGALARHDYDPVSDAVVSWKLEPGRSAGQGFTLPAGARMGGFRVKLQRTGPAGALRYRLGTRPGAADLASGAIPNAAISPWFEHWTTVRLDRPVAARRAYLSLETGGHYDLYGTATQRIDRPEFRSRFEYRENWNAGAAAPEAIFENPANLDYGVRTPSYDDGAAFDARGEPLPALDFAFEIFAREPPAGCQERFAFIEEITGPLDLAPLRDRNARPAADEVEIDEGWTLELEPGSGEPARIAAREFGDFLERAMLVRRAGPRYRIRAGLGGGGGPESFRLRVARDGIEIRGADTRGVMRALHYLEARMRLRRAPFLKIGEEVREPAQSPRITSAPFYSKSEMEAPADQYTDGLLGRIARAGFNAIWVWGDLDEVAHSSVYPELDRGARERQARLNALAQRAARYGIDLYVYLASRPLAESFFARHPEVRGSGFAAYGGVNVMCTSAPQVREHLRAATADLTRGVPALKGIAFIVGGEGFLHCWTRKNTCPRCLRRPPQETIAEFSAAVFEGARSGNPQAAVALWPYSASNTWSRDDPTQSRLLERLPRGMTLLTEFGKEGEIRFGGISIPAYDYPISFVGPSARFTRQSELAARHGLNLWIKTEHAISLEFVDVPYIPAMDQWVERFRRVRESPGATGVFFNWMHYGFTPSLAAELFYWSTWRAAPEPETLLDALAGGNRHLREAWRAFSEAIREYPFSGPMAMGPVQKGPAHPLFLDPQYQPRHGAGRQFKNDLSWTRPWGPELTIAQLTKMERRWAEGVAAMERAGAGDIGVARVLLAAMRSTIHIAQFYLARGRGDLDRMAEIAQAELANARAALPAICADSRLGYANSGKNDQTGVPRAGIYSPGSIEKKIVQVERVLAEIRSRRQAGRP